MVPGLRASDKRGHAHTHVFIDAPTVLLIHSSRYPPTPLMQGPLSMWHLADDVGEMSSRYKIQNSNSNSKFLFTLEAEWVKRRWKTILISTRDPDSYCCNVASYHDDLHLPLHHYPIDLKPAGGDFSYQTYKTIFFNIGLVPLFWGIHWPQAEYERT